MLQTLVDVLMVQKTISVVPIVSLLRKLLRRWCSTREKVCAIMNKMDTYFFGAFKHEHLVHFLPLP